MNGVRPLHIHQDGYYLKKRERKKKKQTNVGEYVEKLELHVLFVEM
jgi:hypothetical protein